MGSWIRIEKRFRETTSHKISDTTSSFHVKLDTAQKVLLLILGTILVVLTKCTFWQSEGALGYDFMKIRHFTNIS